MWVPCSFSGGSKNLTAYLIVANCGFRKLVRYNFNVMNVIARFPIPFFSKNVAQKLRYGQHAIPILILYHFYN